MAGGMRITLARTHRGDAMVALDPIFGFGYLHGELKKLRRGGEGTASSVGRGAVTKRAAAFEPPSKSWTVSEAFSSFPSFFNSHVRHNATASPPSLPAHLSPARHRPLRALSAPPERFHAAHRKSLIFNELTLFSARFRPTALGKVRLSYTSTFPFVSQKAETHPEAELSHDSGEMPLPSGDSTPLAVSDAQHGVQELHATRVPSPPLPYEIVRAIVRLRTSPFPPSNERKTLLSCSLVSRGWAAAATDTLRERLRFQNPAQFARFVDESRGGPAGLDDAEVAAFGRGITRIRFFKSVSRALQNPGTLDSTSSTNATTGSGIPSMEEIAEPYDLHTPSLPENDRPDPIPLPHLINLLPQSRIVRELVLWPLPSAGVHNVLRALEAHPPLIYLSLARSEPVHNLLAAFIASHGSQMCMLDVHLS
ncbi:hypothetical protein BDK51DRAFT_42099 [Blyttiomyces helicus]|uniref:F-box domain-containing protein n=1 Tax=Blyttiomyces helicus TaxID=388810 RepID=A0A4P9VWM5_9FUNG|nr:hypothetical protein BDK51DRAFT_42099 [Blyttiomyces helicus]|eukprot:RKO84119.1 hypothetical protein BDK51DRAFT_42099 [Blyttiomyces helicus]